MSTLLLPLDYVSLGNPQKCPLVFPLRQDPRIYSGVNQSPFVSILPAEGYT